MLTEEPQQESAPQMFLPFETPPVKDWRASVPTVSDLTRRIRGQLESTFGDTWVRGEISNFRQPVSGHAYFILKDASAQIRAVMFKGHLSKLKFKLQDGMEVLMHGKIAVYEPRGEYQIVGDTLEPVGVGALQLAFEQLKMKLAKEGLFDPKKKKPIPKLPKTIGIVTSPTGAAVKDILKVLSRRFPNRDIIILPAAVQGEKAAPEICSAIRLACKWNSIRIDRRIEVLIVGRGGGSMEDMWCFNEEIVARAIFDCDIPIISAVGHEIDFTIADFVADLRAPTPSAAAEIVVPKKDELLTLVGHQSTRLHTVLNRALDRMRLHLTHLGSRLVDPRQRVRNLKENFRLLNAKLQQAMKTRVLLNRRRLESQAQVLNSLSPLQVLGRGYSLTYGPSGSIIRGVNELKTGEEIVTRLASGSITSKVIETSP